MTQAEASPRRPMPGGLRDLAARFAADERGAATVELVVWIPFFFLLFFIVVDASVFYWRYVTMWDAARTAAREVSIGALPRNSAAINTFVRDAIGDDFTASIIGGTTIDPLISVQAPASALSIIGIFSSAIGGNIVTNVRMRNEPI